MASAPVLDPNLLLGPQVIGVQLSLVLLGLVLAQMARYYRRFWQTDRVENLVGVAVVVLLNVIKCGAECALVYDMSVGSITVTNASDLSAALKCGVACGTVSTSVAQLLFARRAYFISGKKWWIGMPIAAASTINGLYAVIVLALGVAGSIHSFDNDPHKTGIVGLNDYLEIFFWIGLVIDCAILAAMAHYLLKSKQGFNPNTDNLLTRLLKLSMSTALATVLVQLAVVISIRATANQASAIPTCPEEVVCVVFAACLLYTLNDRNGTRPDGTGQASTSGEAVTSGSRRLPWSKRTAASGVKLQTETLTHVDFDGQLSREKLPMHGMGLGGAGAAV